MATDLDKMLAKINHAREMKYITPSETQRLRQLARSLANKKGDLGPKDRDQINALLNKSLNKKGQADKADGGLKPPSGGTPSKPSPSQPSPSKPSPSPQPGKTPGDNKEPSKEDTRWKQFKNNWKRLGDADKSIVRKVWPGAGAGITAEKQFRNKSGVKQQAIIDAVDGGDITKDEKIALYKAFNRDEKGNPIKDSGGGGGGGSDDTPASGGPPDDEPASGGPPPDIDEGGDGGRDDGEDEDETQEPDPTQKGGGKKVRVEPSGKTKYSVPEDAEPITMPNIDKKIYRQIKKITKSLIASTKEFIEGGINYDGIDYVAEDEIYTEDGKPYFEYTDYNSPGGLNSGLANERMEEVRDAIYELLKYGDPTSGSYNYEKFIDLFELRYNSDGTPYYRFSLEIEGIVIDDITVTLIEDENTE